jgi:hypothetical protein
MRGMLYSELAGLLADPEATRVSDTVDYSWNKIAIWMYRAG